MRIKIGVSRKERESMRKAKDQNKRKRDGKITPSFIFFQCSRKQAAVICLINTHPPGIKYKQGKRRGGYIRIGERSIYR